MRKIPIALLALVVTALSLFTPFLASAAGNAAPVISSTPSTTSVEAGSIFTYQLTATDADGDSMLYGIKNAADNMSVNTTTGLVTWKPAFVKTNTVEFEVRDSFGNKATQVITFSCIHGTAVSLSVTPKSSAVTAGESVTWKVFAQDTFNNSWDVTSLTTPIIVSAAHGSWSNLTYTSETAGSWNPQFTYQSLTTNASLFVSQNAPTGFSVTPQSKTIQAGNGQTFESTFTDNQGNSWDATGVTDFSANDPDGTITGNLYEPKKTGTFVILGSVNSLNDTADVTVTAGAPFALLINPPSNNIILAPDQSIQLTVSVLDQFGNPIASANVLWSISDPIAEVLDTGVVIGRSVGSATLMATSGDLSVSMPLQVSDTVFTVAGQNTQSSGNTQQNNEGTVKGESTNEPSGLPGITPVSAATTDSNKPQEATCTPPALWIPLVLYAIYAVILGLYYLLTNKEQDSAWWIFPVLLTVIGVIVWSKYLCREALTWWPWTLVFIGLGISIAMKREIFRQPENAPPKQPPSY